MIEEIAGRINGFKCKYIYLDKLFNGKLEQRKPRLIETVNIYINLESLLNSFRSPRIEKHMEKMEKREMKMTYRQVIADIINVAAHYRKYFTRHGVKTNIIYFFNEITDDFISYNNSSLCDGYREHYYDSFHSINRINVNTMIDEVIPFLRIIIEYIENVYLISVKHVESSIVPFIFMMENWCPCNMNIIISKEDYDLQYCNYNCLVISRSQNEPILITKKNLMKYLAWREEFTLEEELHPKLLTFIIACIGDKKRSIPKIRSRIGIKSLCNEFYKLYKEGYLYNDNPDTMNVQNLLHVLNRETYKLLNRENIASDIMANFQVCDFESQYRVVSDTQKKRIKEQLVDRTDTSGLIEINDRYFGYSPIQIMELNQARRKDALV